MDHRISRSPSPVIGKSGGKPMAYGHHTNLSRPSSRASCKTSSRPSSRGSPYGQSGSILLSALHTSPPQPQYFNQLVPPLPASSVQRISPAAPQHRISPLPPLSGYPQPAIPMFQGPGLVNILPTQSAGLTPSPEIAAGISPSSQSTINPLSLLRPPHGLPLGDIHTLNHLRNHLVGDTLHIGGEQHRIENIKSESSRDLAMSHLSRDRYATNFLQRELEKDKAHNLVRYEDNQGITKSIPAQTLANMLKAGPVETSALHKEEYQKYQEEMKRHILDSVNKNVSNNSKGEIVFHRPDIPLNDKGGKPTSRSVQHERHLITNIPPPSKLLSEKTISQGDKYYQQYMSMKSEPSANPQSQLAAHLMNQSAKYAGIEKLSNMVSHAPHCPNEPPGLNKFSQSQSQSAVSESLKISPFNLNDSKSLPLSNPSRSSPYGFVPNTVIQTISQFRNPLLGKGAQIQDSLIYRRPVQESENFMERSYRDQNKSHSIGKGMRDSELHHSNGKEFQDSERHHSIGKNMRVYEYQYASEAGKDFQKPMYIGRGAGSRDRPASVGKGIRDFVKPDSFGKGIREYERPASVGKGVRDFERPASVGKGTREGERQPSTGKGAREYERPASIGKGVREYERPASIGKGAWDYERPASIGKGVRDYERPASIGKGVRDYERPASIGKGARDYERPASIGKGVRDFERPASIGKGVRDYERQASIGKGVRDYERQASVGKGAQDYERPASVGKGARDYERPASIGKGIRDYEMPSSVGKGIRDYERPASIEKGVRDYEGPVFIGKGLREYERPGSTDYEKHASIGKDIRNYERPPSVGKGIREYEKTCSSGISQQDYERPSSIGKDIRNLESESFVGKGIRSYERPPVTEKSMKQYEGHTVHNEKGSNSSIGQYNQGSLIGSYTKGLADTVTTTVHTNVIQSIPSFCTKSTITTIGRTDTLHGKPASHYGKPNYIPNKERIHEKPLINQTITTTPAQSNIFYNSNASEIHPDIKNVGLGFHKSKDLSMHSEQGEKCIVKGIKNEPFEFPSSVANSGDSVFRTSSLSSHINSTAEAKESVNGRGQEVHDKLDIEMVERHAGMLNMRVATLDNFPPSQTSYRATYRSQTMALHRAKAGSIVTPAKSLDLLRQNLQKFINTELDSVVQKYLNQYFKPALKNIQDNSGMGAVSDDTILTLCSQILEEAKTMYTVETRSVTPDDNVSETGSITCSAKTMLHENKDIRATKHSLFNIKKRRGSSDSDASTKRRVKKPKNWSAVSGRSTPSKKTCTETVKKDGPKWDPDNLNIDSHFVMGSKANKALGLGNMRGRLYVKHPDLFKYIGDQEDKLWLFENKKMPSTGGKAYLLVLDHITDLANSDEYKNNSSVSLDDMISFSVPQWMIDKMKVQMSAQRSDKGTKPVKAKPSASPTTKVDELEDRIPFTNMYGSDKLLNYGKSDIMQDSPATDNLDLLSLDQEEDLDTPVVSPFNITGGFAHASPAPSESDKEPLTVPFELS